MELIDAIKARHSVRKYTGKAIDPEAVSVLREAVSRINSGTGLNFQLVLDEPKAFSAGLLTYGRFAGVRDYFVLAGPEGKEVEEQVGYYGEELVLLAQTLGLNTCWVGLTYKKVPGAFTLREGDVVHCVISLGYGISPGVQHPLKPATDFYECEGEAPAWFKAGIDAALLAPTAINQQKFKFTLRPGNVVSAVALRSMAGYTSIDLGIVKYHFEIGAGKENFSWE